MTPNGNGDVETRVRETLAATRIEPAPGFETRMLSAVRSGRARAGAGGGRRIALATGALAVALGVALWLHGAGPAADRAGATAVTAVASSTRAGLAAHVPTPPPSVPSEEAPASPRGDESADRLAARLLAMSDPSALLAPQVNWGFVTEPIASAKLIAPMPERFTLPTHFQEENR